MAQKAIELKIPDIGDSDKIEIVHWNVSAGQAVAADEELCELITEKAAFPLESPANGILTEILKPAGSAVKVGETVAILHISDDSRT